MFLTINIALLGVVFPFGLDRSFELGFGIPLRLLLVQALLHCFLADAGPFKGVLIMSEYLVEDGLRLLILRRHLLLRFGRRPVVIKDMSLAISASPSPIAHVVSDIAAATSSAINIACPHLEHAGFDSSTHGRST